jgi:histidyl-tRNA synthetase
MKIDLEKFLIVSLGEDKKAIQIAQRLRKRGKNVSMFYGKPSKALEYANSYDIKKVIFVGKKEVQQKKLTIKNLKTGKQRKITITKKKLNL